VTVAAEEITDAADERAEDTADAPDALAAEAPVAETVAGQEAMVGIVIP